MANWGLPVKEIREKIISHTFLTVTRTFSTWTLDMSWKFTEKTLVEDFIFNSGNFEMCFVYLATNSLKIPSRPRQNCNGEHR